MNKNEDKHNGISSSKGDNYVTNNDSTIDYENINDNDIDNNEDETLQ